MPLSSTAGGPASEGLLIIGHGTREEQGVAAFHELVRRVEALLGDVAIEPCFLELAEPTIDEAVARLLARGRRRLAAAPLLLFAAGHAKRDIPAVLAAAARREAGLSFQLASPLACHAEVIELSAERYQEAIAQKSDVDAAETLLVLVGRGSRDPEANAEMARFARFRWERTPVGWLEVGFTAMTEPSLDRALRLAASLAFRRIVVQPHLLFDGELYRRIQRQTAAAAETFPQQEWLTTSPLGPADRLAHAMIDRLAEARPLQPE